MTDKIQDELEKEIEKKYDETEEYDAYSDLDLLKARLDQHLSTKTEMIKEFEKMIDDKLDKHIHVVDDCDCCELNVKNLYKLKQKLGELK